METEFRGLNQNIPRSLKSMPILEQWVKKHSARKPLAGVTALFIQHQLGNQVPMTRAMLELGLEKKRLFWLDVPYTSNAQVREELVRMGIPRQNLIVADDYRILMAYAPYQRKRVQELIRRFLEDPPERLLVLDDGAYFLEAASCFKDRLPSEAKDGSSRVAVVEQTTRGVDKIKSSDAMRLYAQSIPIVNVARSTPKKTLEPAFIGRAVCTALKRKLADRFPRGHSSRCLILGFGTIGS